MSRAKWLFLGLASVVVVGCATGSSADDEASADDSGPSTDIGDANKADGHVLGDATGARDVSVDTTTNPPPGDDDSSTGEDTGSNDPDTGGDTNPEEDAGIDATVPDASLPDASIPDTNAPDTTVADAGHDAHDANVPDTNLPDTNVPDTNIPDTNIPDTNIPDTNVPDTSVADAGCSPTGSGYTQVTHAPVSQAKACTATQANAFYTACLAGSASACAAWENSNGTCASCLESATDPTGATWGPYTQWPLGALDSVIELNIGGCLIAKGSTSCGKDFQYLTECEHYYCGTSCYGNSFTHYQDCAAAADKSQCLGEYNAVYTAATPCTTSLFTSSSCLTWTDFPTGFAAMAASMCE